MFVFKPEHQNTIAVLKKHGIIVSQNGTENSTRLTDAIGQLIISDYPQYAHLLHEVDPKTKRSDNPLRIEVPELVKKKVTSLTSQPVPTDGLTSPQTSEEKQELPLSESKPLQEEVPKRKAGRPKGS